MSSVSRERRSRAGVSFRVNFENCVWDRTCQGFAVWLRQKPVADVKQVSERLWGDF